jgi:hypothetical protein
MKSNSMKLALSALGITAILMSPAFAKKPHQVSRDSAAYNTMAGYAKDGSVVAIPNSDEAGR